MSFSAETYALSKKFTNDSISGISGALAGKNCTIQSITEIPGGHRVTFQWTADDSTVRTSTMDVMDGVDGEVPAENLLKDTVGWTGKNLLKTRVGASGSIGNGTWKINSDGSITVNATLSSLGIAPWRLATGGMNPSEVLCGSDIPKGTYRIVWLNANGQKNDNIRLQIFGTNGALNTGTEIANTHTTETVTIDDTYAYYYARVWINTGTINDTMYGMLVSADISDLTYEPYHESVEVMYEEEIHGVNLLKWEPQIENGNVTMIKNADDSISISGTNTQLSYITLYPNYRIKNEYAGMILSGAPSNAPEDVNMRMRIETDNGTFVRAELVPHGGELVVPTLESNQRYRFDIQVHENLTFSNLVFRPMLRKADIEDSTYRPYNYQAVQNQLNAQAVLGAKNLLDWKTSSGSDHSVDFTVNSDKTITADGTATGGNAIFYSDMALKAGTYILNGAATGGQMQAYLAQSPWTNYGYDTGNGVTFTLPSDSTIRFQCIVLSGTTVNNVVFKPMLRLASDADSTYVPYAMTNRELTERVKENVVDIKSAIKSALMGASGSTVTDVEMASLSTYGNLMFVNARINKAANTKLEFNATIPFTVIPKTKGTVYPTLNSNIGAGTSSINNGILALRYLNADGATYVDLTFAAIADV